MRNGDLVPTHALIGHRARAAADKSIPVVGEHCDFEHLVVGHQGSELELRHFDEGDASGSDELHTGKKLSSLGSTSQRKPIDERLHCLRCLVHAPGQRCGGSARAAGSDNIDAAA